ncbi:hypothetical protein [Blastococcus haudaquaticus]|uniref:Uncharacterized protein n=1 Tax=Blastococcus haudaquaticus TaxID=1938745 RepID=A0A286GHI6_9ACTN|nr:hypothetical protein [Blastococcus haudaquaticus]SOD94970.1 hypothetical protein SAMN06272739_1054 [Blastococcus haudaquaticus]
MVVRHVAAVLTGLVIAAALGLLAGVFGNDDEFWLRTGVFAACAVGPAYGVGWLVFLSGTADTEEVARPEETVEQQWWHRSASASFLDVLVVAGVGTTALATTGLEVAATTALGALLVVAMADVAVRLAVLRRREA